ncbi:hypothetical protein ACHWQZ_G005030 [Mnemiopsis leidyi]
MVIKTADKAVSPRKEPPDFKRLKFEKSEGLLSIRSGISSLAEESDSIYVESDTGKSCENISLELRQSEACWLCHRLADSQLIRACECDARTGSVHKTCLINWMNTFFKGRCPRCLYMYRVITDKISWRHWTADPLITAQKTKYILIGALNVVVTVVCLVCVGHLLSSSGYDDHKRERTIIAIAVAIGYMFYVFYQGKVYIRMYERLKIYNNRIWDVYDVTDDVGSKAKIRGNLSSFVNFSDLA